MTVDALIVLKVTASTITAITTMSQLLTIHTIYLPAFSGTITPEDEDLWNNFKRVLAEHTIDIMLIEHPLSIRIDREIITMTPQQKVFRYHSQYYHEIMTKSTIDGHAYRWQTKSCKKHKSTPVRAEG